YIQIHEPESINGSVYLVLPINKFFGMNTYKSPLNTKGKPGKNIFISYREKDSSGEAGRLVDSLKEYFLDHQIFMDIDKIEPGVDFTDAISHSLECCDVMLAIIGPRWMGEIGQSS